MQDVLPEGGVIRKLWVGEAAKFRDHMLRLDPASRNSRFGGGPYVVEADYPLAEPALRRA